MATKLRWLYLCRWPLDASATICCGSLTLAWDLKRRKLVMFERFVQLSSSIDLSLRPSIVVNWFASALFRQSPFPALRFSRTLGSASLRSRKRSRSRLDSFFPGRHFSVLAHERSFSASPVRIWIDSLSFRRHWCHAHIPWFYAETSITLDVFRALQLASTHP